MSETEEKNLRTFVNLKGETKTKYLEIKKRLGIQSDTEVMRFLIANYYRLNIAEGGST